MLYYPLAFGEAELRMKVLDFKAVCACGHHVGDGSAHAALGLPRKTAPHPLSGEGVLFATENIPVHDYR
jgi:hypothetical protein